MIREGDVFYLALAVVFDRGLGDFAEALRATGTDIEDASGLRVVEKPQVYIDDIIDAADVCARGLSEGVTAYVWSKLVWK